MNTIEKVAERPILFSDDMVRALLDGRKTQTRRVVKPQPPADTQVMRDVPGEMRWWPAHERTTEFGIEYTPVLPVPYSTWRCPYGAPGGRLWVRETWGQQVEDYGDVRTERRTVYRATSERRDGGLTIVGSPSDNGCSMPWRPSIHMPRWASRLTLEITNVRLERVQGISHEDVLAEGIDRCNSSSRIMALERFEKLWDSINAARGFGWSVNPWTWALTFRVVEG